MQLGRRRRKGLQLQCPNVTQLKFMNRQESCKEVSIGHECACVCACFKLGKSVPCTRANG